MPLIDIQNLNVSFSQHEGLLQAVRGISFQVGTNESIGIVGESGSGKSVTFMAALRLLRESPAIITADCLKITGTNILSADKKQLSSLRGRVAAMIFQDPMTAFDPVFTIAHQIIETIRTHRPKTSKADARTEAKELLLRVEIKNAAQWLSLSPPLLNCTAPM